MKSTTRFLAIAACVSIVPAICLPLAAQDYEDAPSPAAEPGNHDLPDRSDLGNVVQTARMQYGTGVRYSKQAEKLAAKLAEAPADKREKMEKKIASAYDSAAQAFVQAIQYDGSMLEAYAALGRVLRRQNRPGEALKVHASALQQDPDDEENFAGWSQSLLALDMLGDATQAYSQMVSTRPERAAQLMESIRDWLARKQEQPGDVDPADVERLAAWVDAQGVS